MKLRVDLNADLGEGGGNDEELLTLVTSASIACGFHAGDSDSIRKTISLARQRNVAVGAHPSLFDRENFGRKELTVSADDVFQAVKFQIGVFQAIADASQVPPNHVKPHGALYNMAARDGNIADAIARAIAETNSELLLFAPPGSELTRAGQAHGLRVTAEVFADRNYMPDGSLVPRSRPDALLHDPTEAAARVLRILRDGVVRAIDGTDVSLTAETICVHGDTPGAVAFARALRERLQATGVVIAPPSAVPDVGAGAPSRRSASPVRRKAGSIATDRSRHLAHVASFRDNPIVFVTTCTHRRRPILAANLCHQILREIWERSCEKDGWWVGHYILLPDHVHFFARPDISAKPLQKWVEMWKSVGARRIAAGLKISPPIWQPEYFDRFLRSAESYAEKWNYVEANAIRAGLVETAADWPYRGTIHELRF